MLVAVGLHSEKLVEVEEERLVLGSLSANLRKAIDQVLSVLFGEKLIEFVTALLSSVFHSKSQAYPKVDHEISIEHLLDLVKIDVDGTKQLYRAIDLEEFFKLVDFSFFAVIVVLDVDF